MSIPKTPAITPSLPLVNKSAQQSTLSALLQSGAIELKLLKNTLLEGIILRQWPVPMGDRTELLKQLALDTRSIPAPLLTPLLKNPELSLVTLKITPLQTPLIALTTQKLPHHQPLKLTITESGQLQLLALPPTASQTAQAPPHKTPPHPTPNSLTLLTQGEMKTHLQNTLTEHLRRDLPKAQNATQLMLTLNQLSISLPKPLFTQLIPAPLVQLQQLLQQQAAMLQTLTQTPSPTQALKSLLQQQGPHLEALIKRSLAPSSIPEAQPSSPPWTSNPKALLLHSIAQLDSLPPPPPTQALPPSKGLAGLFQYLAEKTQPSPQQPSQPAANTLFLDEPQQTSLKFLLKEALLPLLHKQLAHIELLQNTAAHELLKTPEAKTLHLELPLPLPEGLGSLSLKMQEMPYPPEEDQEHAPNTAKTLKQWQVTLSFNLGAAGVLSAQIQWQPNKMTTTFWADSRSLQQKTQAKIPQLEACFRQLGLPTQAISCHTSPPPQQAFSLGYHLIDIST